MPLIAVINQYGLNINYNNLIARFGNVERLKRILKAHTVFEIAVGNFGKKNTWALKKLTPYEINDNIITFPRNFIYILNDAIEKLLYKLPAPFKYDTFELEQDIEFADYQIESIEIMKKTLHEKGQVYFTLPTGMGKTITSIGLIVEMGVPTLVVVPTEFIARQWIDDAVKAYPNITAAKFSNSNKVNPNGETHLITVIIINTFAEKVADFIAINKFSMIIFDEAHELHSPRGLRSLWLAQSVPYIVGITATPASMPSGLDKIVTKFLGEPIEQKYELSDIYKVNITALLYAQPKVEKGSTAIETIKSIIADNERTKIIAENIKKLYDAGHSIIVFSELKSYLVDINTEISKLKLSADIDDEDYKPEDLNVNILEGGVKECIVDEVKKAGQQILLTTYGYSRRGVSIVNMTALIFATPRRNGITQLLGRIMRKGSDASIVREVIDIVDTKSSLNSQYYDRRKSYKKYNLTEIAL
jgi:superfamily II DNA or RNA helicase